jgi:hypothetical protein
VLTTTLPDLAVRGAGPDRAILDGATMARATVVNVGVISATHARMRVRDADGALGESNVIISPTAGLAPGESAFAYFPLDATAEFMGERPISITVETLDAAGEFSLSDNDGAFGWVRLPDWAVYNGSLILGAPTPAGTPFTMTVYNASDVSAPQVGARVYSLAPGEGGALLWQGVLPAAGPYGKSRLTALLPGSVPRAYVWVNEAATTAELSTGNNTGRAGSGFAELARRRLQVPIVAR